MELLVVAIEIEGRVVASAVLQCLGEDLRLHLPLLELLGHMLVRKVASHEPGRSRVGNSGNCRNAKRLDIIPGPVLELLIQHVVVEGLDLLVLDGLGQVLLSLGLQLPERVHRDDVASLVSD